MREGFRERESRGRKKKRQVKEREGGMQNENEKRRQSGTKRKETSGVRGM